MNNNADTERTIVVPFADNHQHVAWCERCGWLGELRPTVEKAQVDAARHDVTHIDGPESAR